MTQLDDAANLATAYLKAAENVVQAYRVLSVQHRTALQTNFPTLATGLQLLSIAHKPLDNPPTT